MSVTEPVMPGSPGRCWEAPGAIWPGLLESLPAGGIAAACKGGAAVLSDCLKALRRERVARPVIFVGTGTCGLGAGAGQTLAAVDDYLSRTKIEADVVQVGCIGLCSEEPIMDVQLPGRARVSFGSVTADTVSGLLDAMLGGTGFQPVIGTTGWKPVPPAGKALGQVRIGSGEAALPLWPGIPMLDEHPFLAGQRRAVLALSGLIDPGDIDEYIAWGGYSAAARALTTMTPEELCTEVEASGLRGRGGGGFPTGKKWRFALGTPADQKYLICNADEGDPGAFMDRAVGESDPHRLLEGILIAAYAIGASKAYIYIRAEYPVAIRRLVEAIEQAKAYGLIGRNIFDSGYDLSVAIKQGAGAFVCGEETALIHSIEGRRGMPRPRPPFPAVRGLFDKPTVINNVETLANLPLIVARGHEWYAAMGTATSKGTKVFALSGTVRRTGLIEVPMGTTLRQVVMDMGGGIPNNKRCKAVQIGGPSGGCIPEAHLDIPTDYEALKDFGAIMGSGGLVVVDESTCMVDLAKFFMEFIQSESCGKCIPCREGTSCMLEILQSLCHSPRHEQGVDALTRFQGIMQLKDLAETIKATSLCGLGQTAPNTVLSTLRWFREEYEAHLYDRRCPAGSCPELTGVACQNSCPVGTEVWRYVAHVARGEYAEAYRVIRQANPFPSLCARVCHHPCERNCRAGATGGQPIAIRALKRFVVDRVQRGQPAGAAPVPPQPGAKSARIAVIGAGPAGLTAAHELSMRGHRVTIFERESQPGGMPICAIPQYRLPRDVLNAEIAALLNGNIELKCNVALGRDITIDGLLADGYKAVYLAVGAHRSRKLGVAGEQCDGILPAMEFLKAHNLRRRHLAKGRVGVIGGGNSAIDAARAALRQESVHSVTVFYRRSRAEMPAYAEEVAAALAEGVRIEELVAPLAVLTKDGAGRQGTQGSEGKVLAGMRFVRTRLGPTDASGRRRAEPIAGATSEFDAPLDTLIVAISEQPETELFAAAGLAVTPGAAGTLVIDKDTCQTSRPGVFGGGDAVTGPATVVEAIAAGKSAAEMIDRYVTGRLLKKLPDLPEVRLPSVYVEACPGAAGSRGDDEEELGSPADRVELPELPVDQRTGNFAEVALSIAEPAALCEARRCLRCDLEFTG